MAYPPITDLPNPPQRDGSQTPAQFSSATDAWLTSQNGMVTELNGFGDYIDITAAQVAADADSAELNAANAANSAALSNFKGAWSSLSGSLSKPASVLHNNSYWVLLNNLVDVTASEPSGSNSDWAIVSSEAWTVGVNTSAAIGLNSKILATATGGDITLTPPAIFGGAFLIVSNSPQSDSLVKVAVPSGVTVYGPISSATDGDTITLAGGDTLHIAADSTTIARIV